MRQINNCDELIRFMVEAYNTVPGMVGTVLFEGEECFVDGMMPNRASFKNIIPLRSGCYKFVIQDIYNDSICLYVYDIDDDRYDQTVAIILPKSKIEELFAAIEEK